MIVSLTVNPALDRNVNVDRLVFEDRAYILDSVETAGGRGIHASHVIQAFGGDTLAIATAGGETRKRFEELLPCCQFPVKLVTVASDMRKNFTITDRTGLTIKLNEKGSPLSDVELAEVERAVEQSLPAATWLMLCGSLPPGVPGDFYARLIRMAQARGVKTLLDSDGDALQQGLEAGPTAIAPNQQEAERLLNRLLLTRNHFLDAAQRLQGMGAESVILSLGSKGAIGTGNGAVWEAIPPRVDAVCPIGAGDALAAAFVWALDQGSEFPEAVRWGVATGTATACLPGLSFATMAQAMAMYERVELRRAA